MAVQVTRFKLTNYARRLRNRVAAIAIAAILAGTGPTNASLIGYWDANGSANDSSPTHNNGQFSGSFVTGRPGGGTAFAVGTGTVRVPDNPAYNFQNYSEWSLGFWFNNNNIPLVSTNGNSNRTFIGQDNGSGFQNKWMIGYGSTVFGPNTSFTLHLNNPSQLRLWLLSDPVPEPTGWNQLTIVKTPSAVSFYLNGTSIGSAGYTGQIPDPVANLVFGTQESCCSYGGYLDDIWIDNTAYSAARVQEVVQNGIPEPTSVTLIAAGLATIMLIRRRPKTY